MHELRVETPLETSQRQQNKQSSKKKNFFESVKLHTVKKKKKKHQIHNMVSNIELVNSGFIKCYGTKLSGWKAIVKVNDFSFFQYSQSHLCETGRMMNSQICHVQY